MPPKNEVVPLSAVVIESRIHIIRKQRVMIDFQLAELYEVTTAALNQAVDRNPERFPSDFAFQLTRQEVAALISQSVISKTGRGGRQKMPWAFTEQGVAMLSSVLHSESAIRVNIVIMRAFIRMRQLFAAPGDIIAQLQKLSETVNIHDEQIKGIIDVLKQMMEPPKDETPKRRIGFTNTDNETPPEDKK